MVKAVQVVLPARDEEGLVGRCLNALVASRVALLAERPDVSVGICVVLDRCVDGTEEIVRQHSGVDAMWVDAGSVGAARRAGLDRVAERFEGVPAERVWVACTDADSAVPTAWLLGQLRAAEEGYAVRVGTVLPDLEHVDPYLYRKWLERHDLGPGHTHVHGANLGFSLAAYEQVGGFADLHVGEDVDLVRRLRLAGLPALMTGDDPVLTSGRHAGRLRGGFADYLVGLAGQAAGPPDLSA